MLHASPASTAGPTAAAISCGSTHTLVGTCCHSLCVLSPLLVLPSQAAALGCEVAPMLPNPAALLASVRCNCMPELDPVADVAPLEATMKVVTAPARGAAAVAGGAAAVAHAKGEQQEVVEAAADEHAEPSAAAVTAAVLGKGGKGGRGGKGRARGYLFSRL